MKTADLIAALARGEVAVAPRAVQRRYTLAIGAALVVSMAGVFTFLGLRPDLASAMSQPMLWVKFAFPLVVALAALVALMRLSRPGGAGGGALLVMLAPFLVIWALAALQLTSAPPDARLPLVMGNTWQVCALRIAVIALPAFVGAFWALKGLAPTRPGVAGAIAGLAAGALGAFVYAFHCPEMAAPFLGVWYAAGMLIPCALGGLLGPRLLRW